MVVEVEYVFCVSFDIEIENFGVNLKMVFKLFWFDFYVVCIYIYFDCERINKVKFKWKLFLLDENGV